MLGQRNTHRNRRRCRRDAHHLLCTGGFVALLGAVTDAESQDARKACGQINGATSIPPPTSLVPRTLSTSPTHAWSAAPVKELPSRTLSSPPPQVDTALQIEVPMDGRVQLSSDMAPARSEIAPAIGWTALFHHRNFYLQGGVYWAGATTMFETANSFTGAADQACVGDVLRVRGTSDVGGRMLVAPLIWPMPLPSVLRFAVGHGAEGD